MPAPKTINLGTPFELPQSYVRRHGHTNHQRAQIDDSSKHAAPRVPSDGYTILKFVDDTTVNLTRETLTASIRRFNPNFETLVQAYWIYWGACFWTFVTWVFAVAAAADDAWISFDGTNDFELGKDCGEASSICRRCECLTRGKFDVWHGWNQGCNQGVHGGVVPCSGRSQAPPAVISSEFRSAHHPLEQCASR